MAISSGSSSKNDNSHTHNQRNLSWACSYDHITDSGTLSAATYEITQIPDYAQIVKIVYRNISLSGTDELLLQLGNRSGYVTTGYTGYSRENVTHSAWPSSAAQLQITSLAAYSHCGEVTLTKMESNIWHIAGSSLIMSAGTYPVFCFGYVDVTDVLTSIKFLTNGADTFDAGSISAHSIG